MDINISLQRILRFKEWGKEEKKPVKDAEMVRQESKKQTFLFAPFV